MRYSLRVVAIGVTLVVVILAIVGNRISRPRYTATVLSPTSLRTTAPRSMIASATGKLYQDMRLLHFMDSTGRVEFPDGGSSDNTTTESVRVLGDYSEGIQAFDDPDGNRITVNWYSEPEIGTLITWEYAGGKDPQTISVILQQELMKSGVALN